MATIVSAFLSLSFLFLFLFLLSAMRQHPLEKSRERTTPLRLHPPVRALSSFWIKFHSVFFFFSRLLYIIIRLFFVLFSPVSFSISTFLLLWCLSLSSLGFYFISFYWTFDCILDAFVRSFVRSCVPPALASLRVTFVGIVDFILPSFPIFFDWRLFCAQAE